MPPEIDRLLGEITAGITSLGKSVDTLRLDQKTAAKDTADSHTAINLSIGDMNATVKGHNERIKANKDGIGLIWRVLLSTGVLGLVIAGAVKAMT